MSIPASNKIESLEKGVVLYSEAQPGFDIIERIKFTIEKDIKNAKMVAAGVDDKKLDMIKTNVNSNPQPENKGASTGLTTGIGFGSGLLIYMFIFCGGNGNEGSDGRENEPHSGSHYFFSETIFLSLMLRQDCRSGFGGINTVLVVGGA